MWNIKKKKKVQMNLYTKQKQTHRLRKEWIYGYWGEDEKEGEIGSLGFIYIYIYIYTAIFKIDNQQGPTV